MRVRVPPRVYDGLVALTLAAHVHHCATVLEHELNIYDSSAAKPCIAESPQTALRLLVLKLSSQHKVCERPQPVQICRIVIRVLQSLPTPQCCFVAPRPRSHPASGAVYGIRSTSPGPTSLRFLLGGPVVSQQRSAAPAEVFEVGGKIMSFRSVHNIWHRGNLGISCHFGEWRWGTSPARRMTATPLLLFRHVYM